MPNKNNIDAPVTLIANGRSGTSLCQAIFSHHPDFDTCGETGALLFGVWHSVEQLKGIVRPDRFLPADSSFDLRCGKAVRAAFITTFRAPNKKYWVHKPIGTPWVWSRIKQTSTAEEAAAWYWRALTTAFPQSKTITILRHPYDVVLSASEYWKIDVKAAWRSIVNMAEILEHPASSVVHAVDYDQLLHDPAGETLKLFDAVDRPFHTDCLKAFEKLWVQQQKSKPGQISAAPDKIKQNFSRRESWASLKTSDFSNQDHDTLIRMWAKYGVELRF